MDRNSFPSIRKKIIGRKSILIGLIKMITADERLIRISHIALLA